MSHGFSWLHLSDLHFRGAADGMPPTLPALLADLEAIRQLCGPWDAVFISGDLTWSGQAQQFEDLGRAVLDPLWKRLEALGSEQAVLLAVPGNHDLQRRPGATLGEPATTPIPSGASGFEAYARWWEAERRRPADLLAGQRHGDFGWTFERDGWRLGIQGLNTVERNGGSARVEPVTRTRVDAICGGSIDRWRRKHDATLLLTHHGADWLKATMPAGYPDELLKCDVHLAGHQHSPGLGASTALNAGQYGVELQAPALALEGAGMLQRAGYQAGRILWDAVGGSRLRVWPRQYALTRGGGWLFAADHDGYNLDADQGTFPAQLEMPTKGGSHADVTLAQAVVDAMPQPPVVAIKPGTPVYMSYAWGDQTDPGALREEAAEAIFAWLVQAGYDARRDRQDLRSGDSISSYERQIGTAQHVIVVLSDKYLRSPYCMAELHNIHEHCLRDPVAFLQRVTCVLLEDAAGIRDDLERLRYAREWKERYDKMHIQLSGLGIEAIGLRTFERFHKICDFWRKTDTILGYIADQLNPTGLADIQFNDFEVLKRRLPKPGG